MMDIKEVLLHKVFNKKGSLLTDKCACSDGFKNENLLNWELVEELHKSIIRKFDKRKGHSSFLDNIWGADLADMQLISKFDKGIRFLYMLLIFMVNMLRYFNY